MMSQSGFAMVFPFAPTPMRSQARGPDFRKCDLWRQHVDAFATMVLATTSHQFGNFEPGFERGTEVLILSAFS